MRLPQRAKAARAQYDNNNYNYGTYYVNYQVNYLRSASQKPTPCFTVDGFASFFLLDTHLDAVQGAPFDVYSG